MRKLTRSVTWKAVLPVAAVVSTLTLAVGAWYLHSRPSSLPAEEVRGLLAGNTIEGGWGKEGTAYRQFFAEDGETLYHGEGRPPARGSWKVQGDGAACSIFEEQDEICYLMGRQEDGTLYWIDANRGLGYPFAVLPGRNLPAQSGAAQPGGRGAPSDRRLVGARDGLGDHAGF